MFVHNKLIRHINAAAQYYQRAKQHQEYIEEWLEKNGLDDDDSVRDMLIDHIESGINQPGEFIKFLRELPNRKN